MTSNEFYRAFEDRHRGSREKISSRLRVYLPFVEAVQALSGTCIAVDLGCGRGEWLELLRNVGITARGVDLDDGMLAACRQLGLFVETGDALDYLKQQPDNSLAIVSGFHIVEHMPFERLQELIQESLRVLKPAGLLILETPNPENIVVGTSNFYIDPSHNRPIPHQLLSFLVEHTGFSRAKVLRLQEQPELLTSASLTLWDVISGASPDYAVIGQKFATDENLKRFTPLYEREYGIGIAELAQRYHKLIMNKGTTTTADHPLKTVAVDLTPVLPGGENGGAKVFVLELIRRLAILAPSTQFVLLTRSSSHDELSHLDSNNVSRMNVLADSPAIGAKTGLRAAFHKGFEFIPARYRAGLQRRLMKLRGRGKGVELLRSLQADLLFCPFTAPTYFCAGIPTVCTFYDVQFRSYPQFFDPMDRINREHTFQEACRQATVLAAISDYSRISAINEGKIPPDHVRTIYLRMGHRFPPASGELPAALYAPLGLDHGRYLLYPANFWKHKNHEMLLLAFQLARKTGLPDDIKLVCTGAVNSRSEWIRQSAASMELTNHVVFPGYLTDGELATLLQGSAGVVFPSLYEGFGLPVIEAMAAGIPVACSNVTSLPEVAGGAAILFDPRIPEDIALALISLVLDPAERMRCIKAGSVRAAEFGDSEVMAREYLELFHFACNHPSQLDTLSGMHSDGWAGEQLQLAVSQGTECRRAELELFAPDWLKHKQVQVQLSVSDGRTATATLRRGQAKLVACPVSPGGTVSIRLTPCFTPSEQNNSSDSRLLSVMVKRCDLVLTNGARKTIYSGENQ